jgi:uncharacterized alpha/beta hydrolase family protein
MTFFSTKLWMRQPHNVRGNLTLFPEIKSTIMKTNFNALLLLAATLTYGQPADKYAGFSLARRSVELSTGITMKYTETGRKEEVPVLLLHGVTDSGRSFQLMIEELSKIDSTLRIITPDQE